MLTASCVWAIVVLILVQEQSMAGWAEVDWVSIVPNIITGAVGLAGIGGSLVSAKMAGKSAAKNLRTTLAAENERAKLAEKRRIYANCLSSLNLGFYELYSKPIPRGSSGESFDSVKYHDTPPACQRY